MSAAVVDLNVEQGATLRRAYLVTDSTGAPYDFTGCTGRMMIRKAPGSDLYFSGTSASRAITLTGDRVDLLITDEETDAIPSTKTGRTWSWDMEIVFPSGDVVRLMQGTVNVSPSVTRDLTP